MPAGIYYTYYRYICSRICRYDYAHESQAMTITTITKTETMTLTKHK